MKHIIYLLSIFAIVAATVAPVYADGNEQAPVEFTLVETLDDQRFSQAAANMVNSFGSLTETLTNRHQTATASLNTNDFVLPVLETPNLDTSGFGSLDAYVTSIFSTNSIDSAVTAAGTMYAASVAQISAPALNTTVDLEPLKVPTESLLFGLVLDKSLSTFAANSGELVASHTETGIGNPAVFSQWGAAVQAGAETVDRDLSDTLLSPCYAAYMGAMAGGTAAVDGNGLASDCGACVTGGLYARNEMNRLLDPTSDSQFFDPDDDVATVSEFYDLHPAARDYLNMAYPLETERLQQTRQSNPTFSSISDCSTSQRATATTLNSSMGDVIANITTTDRYTGVLDGDLVSKLRDAQPEK